VQGAVAPIPPTQKPLNARYEGQLCHTSLVQLGDSLRQLVELTHPSVVGDDSVKLLVREYGEEITQLFAFLAALAQFPTAAAEKEAACLATTTTTTTTATSHGFLADESILQLVLLCSCGVAANLSAATVSATDLHATCSGAWWRCALLVLHRYRHQRGLLHFLFSVAANTALCPTLTPSPDDGAVLCSVAFPYCMVPSIVDVWLAALCNLTALHGSVVIPTLLMEGIVPHVQQIMMMPSITPLGASSSTADAAKERLLANGLRLLSNIAQHVFYSSSAMEAADEGKEGGSDGELSLPAHGGH